LLGAGAARFASPASLVAATLTQLLTLGVAHVPSVHAAVDRSSLLSIAQACLFAASIWFWLTVLGTRGADRWRSLLALLATGKVVCLMAAILVLAPRLLFVAQSHPIRVTSLADQHMSGLLMLAACPLTYVLAGVIVAVQWLYDLVDADGRAGPPEATKQGRVG
jgi:putative membrane protein